MRRKGNPPARRGPGGRGRDPHTPATGKSGRPGPAPHRPGRAAAADSGHGSRPGKPPRRGDRPWAKDRADRPRPGGAPPHGRPAEEAGPGRPGRGEGAGGRPERSRQPDRPPAAGRHAPPGRPRRPGRDDHHPGGFRPAAAQHGGRPSRPSAPPSGRVRPAPAEHGERASGGHRPGEARPSHRPTTAPPGRARPGPGERDQHQHPGGGFRPRESGQDDRPRRPPAPAPGGALWLYGLHAVAAALANPARRPRRLLATAEGEAALTVACPPPWPVRPEPAEREAIARLLPPGAPHQGLALLAAPLAAPPLSEALAARPEAPVVVLDQVTDPRNVGAILRVAAAFGAAAVVVQERHAPPETGTMARAAAGALERVPLLRAVNIARTLAALKESGLWVVGLEAAAPLSLRAAGLGGRRTALVLGGEGAGLRRLTRESCDELCRLPMAAGVESLNVSTAAAVALYELTAERLDAGPAPRPQEPVA